MKCHVRMNRETRGIGLIEIIESFSNLFTFLKQSLGRLYKGGTQQCYMDCCTGQHDAAD